VLFFGGRSEEKLRMKKITSLAEFIDAVRRVVDAWTPQDVDWYISPWFRGHGDISWDLDPGWFRVPPPQQQTLGADWYNEQNLLSEFKLRAPRYLQSMPAGDWEWLFIMQHYGLPTRLLDWTESALIGLYFALRDHRGDTDAGVWVLNPWWLNNQSLGRREIPRAGDACLEPWQPGADSSHLSKRLPVAIRPNHGSARIATQRGLFTIHGADRQALQKLTRSRRNGRPHLELWRIPRRAIPGMRKELAIAGVTETEVFQELDALCREIKAGFFGF
jgi:hypothetical protein